jgi:uncharacterized membrane protein YgcG
MKTRREASVAVRRRASRRLALASAIAAQCFVGLGSLVGCNAVLGIEERELVEEAAAGLSCESYCQAVMANCTDAFAQYQSLDVCVATCALLPLGTEEDTTGNTIGCRARNAELAATTGELADHCPLAGPGGGGSCGERCENFCGMFTSVCTASAISEPSACLTFCDESRDNPAWTPLDPALLDHDDSIQCRLWHLGNAAQAPDVHCGHADGTTKCEVPNGGGTGGGGAGGGDTGGGGSG